MKTEQMKINVFYYKALNTISQKKKYVYEESFIHSVTLCSLLTADQEGYQPLEIPGWKEQFSLLKRDIDKYTKITK